MTVGHEILLWRNCFQEFMQTQPKGSQNKRVRSMTWGSLGMESEMEENLV